MFTMWNQTKSQYFNTILNQKALLKKQLPFSEVFIQF